MKVETLMGTQRSNDGWLRIVVIGLGVLVLFPMVMMAVMMPMMGWWWGDGVSRGFSPLWGVAMMLIWVVILGSIGYLLYRGVAGSLHRNGETDPALEELRLAYARGDLTEDEFEERRSKLRREG